MRFSPPATDCGWSCPDGETAGIAPSDLIAVLARRRKGSGGAAAADALTAMRRTMAKETLLRVVASGKVIGYQGRMPGIVEEALLHAEAGRLVVPLGAFGGAARGAAIALGLLPDSAGVEYAETGEGYGGSLEALRKLAPRHRKLVDGLEAGNVLEALATSDEPTAIGAGVVRLAQIMARTG